MFDLADAAAAHEASASGHVRGKSSSASDVAARGSSGGATGPTAGTGSRVRPCRALGPSSHLRRRMRALALRDRDADGVADVLAETLPIFALSDTMWPPVPVTIAPTFSSTTSSTVASTRTVLPVPKNSAEPGISTRLQVSPLTSTPMVAELRLLGRRHDGHRTGR